MAMLVGSVNPILASLETTSVKIEKETETIVKVSILARLILTGDLVEHLYFIEEGFYAAVDGDFGRHAFNPDTIGHGPKPHLTRYGERSVDEIGTTFLLDPAKPISNGSLRWNIPFYLFDLSRTPDDRESPEKIVLDVTKPEIKDVPYNTEQTAVDFEKLQSMFKLIAKIDIVQRFSLENGVFSICINEIHLLSLDLKQLSQIFPPYCFA